MARTKDVVFDSERYEKEQSIKRLLIPLAVLLGVIAVVAAAALLLRGGRGKPVTGGEDTPYPYTWAVNKNGSISLELDRSAAPGYLWTGPEESAVFTVARDTNTEGDKTRFTLTPRGEGRSVLVFALERTEEAADRIFELSVLAEATREGKGFTGNLLGFSGRRLTGIVRGGEDSPYPYTMYTDKDGDLCILITAPVSAEAEDEGEPNKDGDWQIVSASPETALPLGITQTDDTVAAYVRPGTVPGTAEVRVNNIRTGAELRFSLTLGEDGTLIPAAEGEAAPEQTD